MTEIYKPINHIRIVTATSLFDGHDAAINIMRRIIQSTGVEVIHLGHNRSVTEIVDTAIQEDVQAIAVTSYQGGHIEFFKYMLDMLKEKDYGHVKIFGGGGGVILPDEIAELENYGIEKIYSPDDGRTMGLQGMINDLIRKSDFPLNSKHTFKADDLSPDKPQLISRLITLTDNHFKKINPLLRSLKDNCEEKKSFVLGVTGTGGAGKSSLLDELVRRFKTAYPQNTLAILSVDPTKRKTGGALLGDRIRMNSVYSPNIFMRSVATRQSNLSLSRSIQDILCIIKSSGFDLVILETSGIGQSDTEIVDHSDLSVYVMTPEYGSATQLEKIDMLDFADLVVINKFDKRGAEDALRDVKKQYQRNHKLFEITTEKMPVWGTVASNFRDAGVDQFFKELMNRIEQKTTDIFHKSSSKEIRAVTQCLSIIPGKRVRYLSEISDTVRNYNEHSIDQSEIADKLYSLKQSIFHLKDADKNTLEVLNLEYKKLEKCLDPESRSLLKSWDSKVKAYKKSKFTYEVRAKKIEVETTTVSLSHQKIPKISLPKYKSWGDILLWNLKENLPGEFPFAAGVFPFKRENEDPTRMFAGEGGPERTNRRFHYLSYGQPAQRLSTAFDSVTLYGADPETRLDIYGKIGNAGVSIACLDDAKKLYSGFNLLNPTTSVSMTINGPAPIMVGFFMNAAIDQQCELYIMKNGLEEQVRKKVLQIYKKQGLPVPVYRGVLPKGNDGLGLMLLGVTGDQVLPQEVYAKIKNDTISGVRGTVQADILKEDQAQNTCVFSTDFALKLMGDIQEYFIKNHVRNFYSVSISGYHIAEAGANPITQLALTLSNGFTYVEYYLSRGMKIDDFAPNFSFFFSNGLDPEYTVIGRVARIIWAKAMKHLYGANERSQKLKYHIQTSGRSLHAQEIEFNDIRTTLQGLSAVYDNCNSLHTNAYDEAITTPTEESVRRALAIQLIINHELGLTKNQNPLQGSFIIEELTELVEEAVLIEFDRISERGGVLGAMEMMYQRSQIQSESMYYEEKKYDGSLPLMGVNTFLSQDGSPTILPDQVIRATKAEKDFQVKMIKNLYKSSTEKSTQLLDDLKDVALNKGNIFESLMEVSKYCSLGKITDALYEVGGQYRRNM
ncbi:MAG: methylmalonyl-CoA mutase family protein [Bacteroidota bacterium]|nr:methylmalonyl-CoA mutase family protein [Bacteroidota bacterium]